MSTPEKEDQGSSLRASVSQLSSASKVKPGGKFFKMEVEGRSSLVTDKVTHAIMRRARIVGDGKEIEESKIGGGSVVADGVRTLRGLG